MQAADEIVSRALRGHMEAFGELIRLYQREVWAVISSMLLDNMQTEDLVQQTFVTAYRKLDSFQQGRDFGAWIKAIARNQVRQELRSRQREGSRMELYHQHLLREIEDPATTERQTCVIDALRACTQTLPTASAEVIQMRYEQGLDFGRIAELLGRTVEATRQHLARVRVSLRDCIQKRIVEQ